MDWSADLDCKIMNRTAIILFGRLPVPGKVKTRLAKSFGDKSACEVYKDMCENIVTEAVKSTASVIFMCSESSEVPEVKKWLRPFANPSWKHITVRPQVEGDLGARITHAFLQAFEDGCDEVIVAGTDIPDLSLDTFTLAFLHLQSFDVVIGPSEDDGYYLIGMHRKAMFEGNKDVVRKLFKSIHWSTSLVYRDQVSTAYKLELSVSPYKCLPVLIDIDTKQDAELWIERVQRSPNIQENASSSSSSSSGASAAAGDRGETSSTSSKGGKDYYKRIYHKIKSHFPNAEQEHSISFNIAEKFKLLLTSPPKRHDLQKARERTQIAKRSGRKLLY